MIIAGALSASLLSGCGTAQAASATNTAKAATETTAASKNTSQTKTTDSKTLIVYFAVAENSDVDAASSASVVTVNGEAKGKIRHVADVIQAETGGDLFAIETSVRYPGNGDKLVDYAAEEQDNNVRPELTSHIANLDQYDTIFIGYPTWWYDLPQVLYSFFDEYDLSGKKIIPFNTHNGSRFSGTISTIQKLEPNATVIKDGYTVSEHNVPKTDEEIASWLRGLGY